MGLDCDRAVFVLANGVGVLVYLFAVETYLTVPIAAKDAASGRAAD